jgi:hypothetical protein
MHECLRSEEAERSGRLLTATLHGNRGTAEAEPSKELRRTATASTEQPRDRWSTGRCLRDQGTTDALAAKRWSNDDHGKVPVGQAIRDSAREADNVTIGRNRNDGSLTGSQQRCELRKRSDTVRPAIGREKLMDDSRLGRLNASDFHVA